MKNQYKNVLVTGGSGFLASHLITDLTKKGYKVTIIDVHKPNVKNVNFVMSDFSNANIMKPLLEKTDVVFHLAAIVGVDKCRLNPNDVIKTNYKDTKKFIKLCEKTKVKKFIFTSSSEVYGNSPNAPFKESDNLHPVSIYGKTKVLIEKHLKIIANRNNMKIGIVRLFNVYGPHQKDNFVIPIFLTLAIKNKNLPLVGNGNQIRCFTYVKDVVEGIVRMLEYDETNYEIINIGRKHESTIKDLAFLILKLIPQSKSKLIYKPYGKSGIRELSLEVERRIPSVEKAKALLGFEAKTSLEEGINDMLTSKYK